MYEFYTLLDTFQKAGMKIYETFKGLWELMNTQLNDFVDLLNIPIPNWLINTVTSGMLSYTPLELMIGAGLTFFIGFTIVKWVLDIAL